ncbi:MAG: hypothetical protein ACM36C_04790, partial [Acidobacteriota bacterium]
MSPLFNRTRTTVAAGTSFGELPLTARVYVTIVILVGAYGVVAVFPRTYPPPVLFATLVVLAGLTSSWKVNVPIPIA